MADEQKNKEKKIIIDEDFKAEVEKEKEKLAAEEEKQQTDEKQQRGPLPKGDLAALISMLTTQAFFAMGAFKIEGQESKEPDMELAKYNIDMLETLEEKTKGNLSEQEQKVLTETLNQVRMAFVQITG